MMRTELLKGFTLPKEGTAYYTIAPDFSREPMQYRLMRYSWSGSRLDKLRFLRSFYLSYEEGVNDVTELNYLLEKIEDYGKNDRHAGGGKGYH